MSNLITNSPLDWQNAFVRGFEEKYIKLIIYCYDEITKIPIKKIPIETTRKNMLCHVMRKHKKKFGINYNIASENDVWDETFIEKGRIDICCYLSELDEVYLAFECKRILQKDIIPSHIKRYYYGEGIKRFEDKVYSSNLSSGGMVLFLESGDYNKLSKLMQQELPNYACDKRINDISSEYGFNHVYESYHTRSGQEDIKLSHILMDFSQSNIGFLVSGKS